MQVSVNWPYRRLADLTSKELLRRAVEYRQMAILARPGHETIRALNTLAVRFALLAAKREIKETSGDEAGDHQDRSRTG
jgi:signal transduction histidine kinase